MSAHGPPWNSGFKPKCVSGPDVRPQGAARFLSGLGLGGARRRGPQAASALGSALGPSPGYRSPEVRRKCGTPRDLRPGPRPPLLSACSPCPVEHRVRGGGAVAGLRGPCEPGSRTQRARRCCTSGSPALSPSRNPPRTPRRPGDPVPPEPTVLRRDSACWVWLPPLTYLSRDRGSASASEGHEDTAGGGGRGIRDPLLPPRRSVRPWRDV